MQRETGHAIVALEGYSIEERRQVEGVGPQGHGREGIPVVDSQRELSSGQYWWGAEKEMLHTRIQDSLRDLKSRIHQRPQVACSEMAHTH